jgi:hypothetical protein
MTTSKTAVDNSQDDNAKKTVGHQIESSEFECIGGDILDTLPDCVPLPCARRVGTSTRYPHDRTGCALDCDCGNSVECIPPIKYEQ